MSTEQSLDPHRTDDAWRSWGELDPYFGVITDEKYRRGNLTALALDEFFRSGQGHVRHVLNACRRYFPPASAPQRILDFGCGVGRLLVPFAATGAQVTGVDISQAMLDEARKNCDERGHPNVELVLSDDSLSRLEGSFDLVHSVIVFQHIPPERGRVLIARLVERLNAGGVGVIHLTYGKSWHADSYGQPVDGVAAPPPPRGGRWSRAWTALGSAWKASAWPAPPPPPAPTAPATDPEMLMNVYPMNEILFIVQAAGIRSFHAEFTNHGGELGTVLYFQRPVR
jgi:SAM-dependent methyltransferase